MPHSQKKTVNIKQKQYCNKFSKDFKNGPHEKNLKKKKIDRGPTPVGPLVETPPANAEDMGSIPGLGRFHIQRSSWARASQLLSPCSRVPGPQLLKPVLEHHS